MPVPSPALAQWQTVGLVRLNELARIHGDARGSAPGRRWGVEQLIRSLFVALLAHFQTDCREVHNDAVEVHATRVSPQQQELVSRHMSQGAGSTLGHPERASWRTTSLALG